MVIALTLVAASLVGPSSWVLFARQRRQLWLDRRTAWWLWHWFTGGPAMLLHPNRRLSLWRRAIEAAPFLDTARSDRSTGPGLWEDRARRVTRSLARTYASGGMFVIYGATERLALIAILGASLVTWVLAWLVVHASLWLWWVRPLHHAVYKDAGWEEDTRPLRYIRIWRAHELGGLKPRLKMHRSFDVSETNKDRVVHKVLTKVDLGEVDHRWHLAGRSNSVSFHPASLVPEYVPYSDPDIRRLMEGAKPGSPLLGLGRDGVPVPLPLDGESPHMLLSAPSGGGKSIILTSIVMQMMVQDPTTQVVVIDGKRHSHKWLAELPGVTYARSAEEIHNVLAWLGAEGMRRNKACDSVPLADLDAFIRQFPRLVLVFEEMNSTIRWLEPWWAEHRRSSDPKDSPALTAFRELLFMGRAVRINVLAAAQRASVGAVGGGDARENFGSIILGAGHSVNTQKIFGVDDRAPTPEDRPGWALLCRGSSITEVQTVLVTPGQAQKSVATARPNPQENYSPHLLGLSVTENDSSVEQGESNTTTTDSGEDHFRPVTLREAVDEGIITVTLAAARQASSRDPDFPAPHEKRPGKEGDLYWDKALERWELNRPRAKVTQAHDPICYFLVPGGKDRLHYGGDLKIGWTTNLEQRLRTFAMGPGSVLMTKPDNLDRDVESEFHKRFHEQNVPDSGREWFVVEDKLAEYLGVEHP